MKPVEIKILLLRKQQSEPQKDWSITAVAERIGCRRQELSMCIRQVRVYPDIQEKFAEEIGVSKQTLFGVKQKAASKAA
jgi:DNA-binding XRE family transcriptional regulator